MCGRFVLKATPEEIADYLDLIGLEDFLAALEGLDITVLRQ